MILLSSWWNIKAGAQTFHTVVGNGPRYKVEQSVTSIQQETTLCDSSQTILAKPEQKATTSDTKRTEQTSYPLQVAYPLRQAKLVVTSPYGWRKHPVTGVRNFHNGVDLRANFEPVYAMLPGEVISTGYESKGGNYITLRHGGIHVSYCHLSFIAVKKGSSVFPGQAIGVSGNSGTSTTGPHLHIAVKDDNKQSVSAELLLRRIGGILQSW
jgi:murein DD-endopeptidase MepM/ murein hydrolase activator NlpD